MNILVLNGSPKGKKSVTIQTSLYLQKLYDKHQFTVLNVAQKINAYTRDFTEIATEIEKSDLIIFSYPVYTFLAPFQLHKIIEVMKQKDISLEGKFVTQITTSKHFFDTTAHRYIEQNAYDLGAKFIQGLWADMEDLLEPKGREQAQSFFDKVLYDVENDIYISKPATPTKIVRENAYQPSITPVAKTKDKDVLVVTNVDTDDLNLNNMIADFIASCEHKVRVINVREFKFSGGCLGCMNCTTTAKCIYKDNFDDFLRSEIETADAIIYAYTIENHYTHSSLKCYDDRQFCNGHRTVTHGMPIGYIISGDYNNESNVQTLVEARAEVGGLYLCGVATDQTDTSGEIQMLAKSLHYSLEHRMNKPTNFYGVGGTKIFRDLVYVMQGLMKADHKYYKEHGIYDFPQKQKMKIFQMKLIGMAMSSPKVQKKMRGKMSEYIIMPYTKVIEEAQNNNK